MSLISGDSDNFFSRMGESVSIGDHCECLVKAAAMVAFPSNQNWKFFTQYRPRYVDKNIGEDGLSRDKFDLLAAKFQGERISKAIVMQVTKYRDKEKTQEESNKNYEALETLEEFYFLGSRTRFGENQVVGLPKDTLFGNIVFGNRRMTRKWIPTQQEISLDFVIYPSYEQSGSSIKPACGWEVALRNLWNKCNANSEKMINELQSIISRNECILGEVGNQIRKRFEKLLSEDLPMNPSATEVFKARHEYRKTSRYASDYEFLGAQISEKGLPSERFKLKQSLLSKSFKEYPAGWADIMKNITEVMAKKRPHVSLGMELYNTGFVDNCIDLLLEEDFTTLVGEFNETNESIRKAKRLILLRVANLPIEELHQFGVNEQNYGTIELSSSIVRQMLQIFSSKLKRMIVDLAYTNKMVKRKSRSRVFQGIRYDAVNGTSMMPCKWVLEYLFRKNNLTRYVGKTKKSPSSFVEEVLDKKIHQELQVFGDLEIEDVRGHAYSMRPQIKLGINNRSIFIQTKPVMNEGNRRAKEEGCKVWTSRFEVKTNLLCSRKTVFTNEDYWIYVDGDWKNRDILDRMVECGIRVFLDPFALSKELIRITNN
jgi:hypothetical protein